MEFRPDLINIRILQAVGPFSNLDLLVLDRSRKSFLRLEVAHNPKNVLFVLISMALRVVVEKEERKVSLPMPKRARYLPKTWTLGLVL